MLVSAELRWFWKEHAPDGFERWFEKRAGACAPGGGRLRVDLYLRDPGQLELSLKKRGGKAGVEVKGLVEERASALAFGPFSGHVQIWTKWTSQTLLLDEQPLVATEKTRRLRKYDTAGSELREIELGDDEQPVGGAAWPERGCNVELTRVRLGDGAATWWTFGCEAFGPLDTVETGLRRTLEHLAATEVPPLANAHAASYPAWLAGWDTD